MSSNVIDRISYTLFGRRGSAKAEDNPELANKYAQARIGVPFAVYISRAYFLSVFLSLPLGVFVYVLIQDGLTPILGNISFLIIPLLALIFGFTVYNAVLFYPSFQAKIRGRKIDIVMPHTIALMHALSRGNSDIISFFEIIVKNKDIYGEISREAAGLLVDTRILNLDIKSSLKNSASNSPSESFKNFLESLATLITSGGNLVAFFLAKSEQYRLKALNENKAFMETLSLFSEIYVTGLAAGPLFIIVLLVVLGLIGGAKFLLLLSIVYLLIPGGSLLFILFISSLAEGTGSNSSIKIDEDSKEDSKNPLVQKANMRMQIYDFLKNPLKKLTEVPERILSLSIPVGLMFFILSTYNYYGLEYDQLISKIDDYLVFTTLIVLVPYALFVEAHFRRIERISENFPEFLSRLSHLHESGLTISASLKRLMSSNLGILNSEINKLNTDIELNGSIVEAFRNFGKRVSTVTVQRVVVLIENASRMTGNIKDTLMIASTDAQIAKSLEEDRKRETRMQIVILYISFFVFLYVIWSLVTGFLPQMQASSADSVGETVEGIAFSGIDKPLYVRLFFHASLLEGFFSGLVAGQIGEGDARRGLKHSLIMITAAYVLFMFMA